MSRKKFHVAIMHGHSNAWQKLEVWIKEARFTPRVLKKESSAAIIFERLREVIWNDIYCAVIVMSADDIIANGKKRARQNVVFEMGYCFGAFDSIEENNYYNAEDAIIFLKEEGVELFADIHGLTYIEYNNRNLWRMKRKFMELLENRYEHAKEIYPELR